MAFTIIQRVEPSAPLNTGTQNQNHLHFLNQDSGYISSTYVSDDHLGDQFYPNRQLPRGDQVLSSPRHNSRTSDWRSNEAQQNLETDEAAGDFHEITESQTNSTENARLLRLPNNPREYISDQDSGYITSENITTCSFDNINSIKCIIQQYNTTEKRFATFDNFPSTSPISRCDLAEAGLYYVGPGDKVKCAYCLGKLYNWEEGDKPLEEHSKHFRNCPYVKYKICENKKKIVPHINTHIRTVESVEIKEVIDIVKRLGYEDDLIKSAVSVLQTKGVQKLSSSLVLDAIFKIEEHFSSDDLTNFSKNTITNSSESDDVDSSLILCNDNSSQPELASAQLCEDENKASPVILSKQNACYSHKNSGDFEIRDQEPQALAAASSATLSEQNACFSHKNSSDFEIRDQEPPALAAAAPATLSEQNACSKLSGNDVKFKHIKEDPVKSSAFSPATDSLSKQNTTPNKQVNSTSPQSHSLLNSGDSNMQKLSQELKNLKQTSLCNKCYKNKSDMLYLPCRHKVACEKCSSDIDDCIKCSKKIVATVKVFMI